MQCRIHKRHGWIPGLGRCPGEWNSNPAFLPGESHGQRNLMGYSPWGCRAGHDSSDLAHKHTRYEKSSLFSPHLPKSSVQFSPVQFSCSVVSDSLRPRELQHTRPPCPSPTPGVHPNPCPLNRWGLPTISSSVVPFSFCPQSFPASESFPMNQFFASGGQSIGVSASTSVLPMNTQDWSPLGWAGWISL